MSDYVTIERADNEAMAELIKQRLDESGIPCQLVPSNLSAIAGAGAAYAVTVPADRADDARARFGAVKTKAVIEVLLDQFDDARALLGD